MAERPAKSPIAGHLVYRHNRITRLTHWISGLALIILFMSGLQIFNAHPYLYWGSTSDPDKAFLSIAASQDDGDVRGFVDLYGRKIDTTGFLGVQQGVFGPFARAFPSWLTVPGYYSLAAGRRWHFFFGWLFAISGVVYLIYNLAVGHIRKFLFTLRDAKSVPAMTAYYLHIRKTSPQEGEYNPLQKMAYTGVFVDSSSADLAERNGDVTAIEYCFSLAACAFRRQAIGAHGFTSFWRSGFCFFPRTRVHGSDPRLSQ
jgi:thiosulfate reductase cytochrome b subunit